MPDDEHRMKYSAAKKMQLLKTQQAKLEVRPMPAHSQLKLKAYDKKMKKKRKKKITQKKPRVSKQSQDNAESSTSSRSKKSLASAGGGSARNRSPTRKSDIKEQTKKDEQEVAQKWKRRTEYIYEAERIAIKLKEIATECEKDIELRVAMDDIASGMETLKRTRDEYYQFVHSQNDMFEKQIKMLDDFNTKQIAELNEKVQRLSCVCKTIDTKLLMITAKLEQIAAQQAQKTPTENLIEAISRLF